MNLAQWMVVGGVRLYQWTLSPLKTAVLGPAARCRFHPSCSAYLLQAVQRHGAARGLWLGLRRLLRCHPWGECGHDPVPDSGCGPTPSPVPPVPHAADAAAERLALKAGCRH